jgi:hypothetical protein
MFVDFQEMTVCVFETVRGKWLTVEQYSSGVKNTYDVTSLKSPVTCTADRITVHCVEDRPPLRLTFPEVEMAQAWAKYLTTAV